ncbi:MULTISPECIES: LysR substrate-binding domain-containing protein [Variovorax]|uniref:LysR substrate-binding domain-containing protein n=1 Tax=Variovorax TaxID=34072 RepID=UPI00285A6359|nr:LysR substrate-binding domain-containing protein [Variovorax sp. 3319]MDR6890995.1 DNA-binding transcriptional LysR family regulator [Variovorax sp. 3319]
MRRISFDIDVLRSFVTGIELGSFSKAADKLGRSSSAVSVQLKKLEELVGEPVFRKAGRGLALTETGELMLAYARRMLELNDEAASAVRGVELAGCVRLGLQEDFGEVLLPEVLGMFMRAHPKVRVEVRVARNAELLDRIDVDKLDLALVWRGEGGTWRESIADVPMRWIAPAGPYKAWHGAGGAPLPVAAFDMPCYFRSTGAAHLDRVGIAWRHSFTSPNLGALWAAVTAGLGVTIRTELGLSRHLRALNPGEAGLPVLPSLPLTMIYAQEQMTPPVAKLAAIVSETVRHSVDHTAGALLHDKGAFGNVTKSALADAAVRTME